MHQGTCVTHVPWRMSGLLTRGGRENFPGIPGACATRNYTYLARAHWWHGSSSGRALTVTLACYASWSDSATQCGVSDMNACVLIFERMKNKSAIWYIFLFHWKNKRLWDVSHSNIATSAIRNHVTNHGMISLSMWYHFASNHTL